MASAWTVDEVCEWMNTTVGFPQYEANVRSKEIDGAKLLQLTRRELDGLGVNPMHLRKIDFSINKLKDEEKAAKEHNESLIREAAIMQKMEAMKASFVAGASTNTAGQSDSAPTPAAPESPNSSSTLAAATPEAPVPAAISQETTVPATTEYDLKAARSWSKDTVVGWLQSVQLGDIAAIASSKGVTGEKLVATPSMRQLFAELGLVGIDVGKRRKLEYEISRLQDLVLATEKEERERLSRMDAGEIKSPIAEGMQKYPQVKKYLSNGVYVIRDITASTIRFSAENTAPEDPCIVILKIDNSDGFLDYPDKELVVKLFLAKGQQDQLIEIRPKDSKELWSFKYACEQHVGTMDDFLDAQDNFIENTIKLIAPIFDGTSSTDADTLDQVCSANGVKYIDSSFPPTKKSLYIDLEDLPKGKDFFPIQWKRPSEFFKETLPTLFDSEGIQPSDILQGRLGDCWLLAALSLIARRPELVIKLFLTVEYNKNGIYAMQFCRGEEWIKVVVDDYLPCVPLTRNPKLDIEALLKIRSLPASAEGIFGGPVYAGSKKGDLWVALLEKAYAKLNNSYQALTSGSFSESMHDLTGAPCVSYNFKFETDMELVWNRVKEGCAMGYLLGASSRAVTMEERAKGIVNFDDVGIVTSHAYSLFEAKEVAGVRLLRLRNPWGGFGWKGDYSDNSSKWTAYLKEELNFEPQPGSGCFWICWKDFTEYFHEITVCKIGLADSWNKIQFKGEYTNDALQMYGPQFELTVKQKTTLIIQLSKTDTRYAVGADKDNRHGLYILKQRPYTVVEEYREDITDGARVEFQYECVDSTGDWSRREVALEVTLEPSEDPYLLVVSGRISNRPEPIVKDLIMSILAYTSKSLANESVLEHVMFTLMHYGFYHSNRKIMSDLNAIPMLLHILKTWLKEKYIQKEGLSLLWNLSCDTDVRARLNHYKASELVAEVQEYWWKNEEIQESARITLRNLSLKQGIAMDELIEKCIIANACTFCVTGSKTFLLQSWHDCYTCNLRSGYGICSTCVETCHKGHKISPPKYSRFYCDCGHGSKTKKGHICRGIKSAAEIGLEKKRERDEDYRGDEEDDPTPFPHPGPKPKPAARKDGPATIFDLGN